MSKNSNNPFDKLPPFDAESGKLNIIIDTPKDKSKKAVLLSIRA